MTLEFIIIVFIKIAWVVNCKFVKINYFIIVDFVYISYYKCKNCELLANNINLYFNFILFLF